MVVQIEDNFHKFATLAVFGAVDAVCSVLFGSLRLVQSIPFLLVNVPSTPSLCTMCSDRVGKLPVLSVAFVAHGTVFVYFYLYWHSNDQLDPLHTETLQHDWYVFCVVAVFLGVGDAGFNTQLYTLYESLLGKETEVFANLKFWQSVCSQNKRALWPLCTHCLFSTLCLCHLSYLCGLPAISWP